MPTLTELTGQRARVSVTYNGVVVQAEYNPDLVTEKALSGMLRIATDAPTVASLPDATGAASIAAASGTINEMLRFTGSLNTLLARLLCWWDLTDDDGAMYPLEAERLADLPLGFRQAVLAAVFGDLRLDPTPASDTLPISLATSVPSRKRSSRKRA